MAGEKALLGGYRSQGGSRDRLSGPQNCHCQRGWSTRSTPGCLGGRNNRLEPGGMTERLSGFVNDTLKG